MKKLPRSASGWSLLVKNNFLTGFFLLAPFAIILWVCKFILSLVWDLPNLLPAFLQPTTWVDPASTLYYILQTTLVFVVLVILLVLVSMIGFFSKRLIGKRVFQLISDAILKIPVLRSIYSGVDQLFKTFGGTGEQKFSRVVYVEYPRRDAWTIAFVTGPVKDPSLPEDHVNIYIPTTPNPTSGFHLMVPSKDLRNSSMKVEDALKTIMTFGIAAQSSKTEKKG